MDIDAANYSSEANEDDASCLYNDICCPGFDLECIACQACQTPEEFCLANPGYDGCDAYDVIGCMDDGLQEWSPFPVDEGWPVDLMRNLSAWGVPNPSDRGSRYRLDQN